VPIIRVAKPTCWTWMHVFGACAYCVRMHKLRRVVQCDGWIQLFCVCHVCGTELPLSNGDDEMLCCQGPWTIVSFAWPYPNARI
jgi:hypothetical protein